MGPNPKELRMQWRAPGPEHIPERMPDKMHVRIDAG